VLNLAPFPPSEPKEDQPAKWPWVDSPEIWGNNPNDKGHDGTEGYGENDFRGLDECKDSGSGVDDEAMVSLLGIWRLSHSLLLLIS
jgi:hypothetical protein